MVEDLTEIVEKLRKSKENNCLVTKLAQCFFKKKVVKAYTLGRYERSISPGS